jgi:hypothetical protein
MAEARTKSHDGKRLAADFAVLNNSDYIGIIAEGEFAKKYGLLMSSITIGKRDPGWDFVYKGKKIDIKATERANGNLIVPKAPNRPRVADIYVLAIVNVGNETANFVGWIDAKEVMLAPVRDLGRGSYPVYFVDRKNLRPMDEL